MIKAADRKVPLWMLFIAVQVPDIIWGILILLGVERAGLNETLTSNPLELSYMPYSHGFLSTIIYSLAIVGILLLFPYFRKQKATAWWLGAAIFSHWVLDFISHRPDLPLYGNSMKVGLGLWNHSTWAVLVEVGIYVIGAIWYAYSVGGFKRWATWLFWGFILVSILGSSFRGDAMGPSSVHAVAISALCFYLVSTLIIYVVERNQNQQA